MPGAFVVKAHKVCLSRKPDGNANLALRHGFCSGEPAGRALRRFQANFWLMSPVQGERNFNKQAELCAFLPCRTVR